MIPFWFEQDIKLQIGTACLTAAKKMLKMELPSKFGNKKITLQGLSKAADCTHFHVPELSVALDAG